MKDSTTIYLIAAIFLILFEAIPEGLRDRGKKTIAGVIEFIYLAAMTLAVFAWLTGQHHRPPDPNLWFVIAGYILLRYAIFDAAYNLARGNPLFYIGNTKIYDRLLGWFFRWSGINSDHLQAMFKFIALLIGVTWLMGWNQ